MPLPSYYVELQFGASPYIDITFLVQSISISRGISRVLEDFSAGTLSITFVNNNRVFDPLNTSSLLWYASGGYTMVQPGGNIRVSSNGVRRFTGFVQNWEFSYSDSGFDGQATVTALDMMYKVSNASFTGGTQPLVQATSERVKLVMDLNGFTFPEFSGVLSGQTLVGYDENAPGDNVLSYLQNLARSEPADFYSNASAVIQMKDRSFTNYEWTNTNRYNLISYPSTATFSTEVLVAGQPRSVWTLLGTEATATPSDYGGNVWRGGTVADPFVPADSFVGFVYQDYNPARYEVLGNDFTFAGLIRGGAGTFNISLYTLDVDGQFLGTAASTVISGSSTAWLPFSVYKDASGGGLAVGGLAAYVQAIGSTAYVVTGDGFRIEPATSSPNYFDGDWNPYKFSASASTAYEIAWSGVPRQSQSGLLTSVASAISAPAVRTFADANSQGVAYGNGTGIPFTDLQVVYSSDQLYNEIQVVGVNATAVRTDTVSQSLYGKRVYSQTDNLTTSTTEPGKIARAFLGEFRLPEYRAELMTVALESLTSAQQNIVLGIEIRDVVRLIFRPSNSGSIVDKYYQVLGVDANADVERDAITFKLASLDNLPFRLDSPFLGVLDTDTLA